MSINHFSSDHLPEAHWWSHYTMDHSSPATANTSSPHTPFISTHTPNSTATFLNLYHSAAAASPMLSHQNSAALSFDLNNEDDDDEQVSETNNPTRESEQQLEQEIPKERLFEKPLTPSDVGKLNRLVIPKQHAEKHFPLNGGGDSGENGLLLGFEDELGKSWRFRYSYWNSSQSYVLTKGWSRFVKEKRLDAGDIVIFARHGVDAGRFFIGWRRRNSVDSGGAQPATAVANNGGGGGAGGWSRGLFSGQPYHHQIQQQGPSNCLSYQPESPHAGPAGLQNQTTSTSGNSRTVRLFGVNLECQADESSEASTPLGSPMSSHHHPYHHQYNYSNHMDIGFSGADVDRQG